MFGPYADAIRRSAAKRGIPPDVLAGVLAQESGFNPQAVGDNGQSVGMGQFNTRGALADYGLDRSQILAMDPEQQIDLVADFLARKITGAGGDLWSGVRAYNGGGDPHYVENVRKRMTEGGAPVDVRMAATGELPPRMAVPGDPMTGMAGPERGPDLDAKTLDILRTFLGEQEDRKPGLWEDPLLQMGLGILATPTGTGSPMMGIARGMQAGLKGAQEAQQFAQQSVLENLGKKLFAVDLAQRQVGISGLNPAQRVAAQSNATDYMSPDGKTIKTVYFEKLPDGRQVVKDVATGQVTDINGWREVGALSQSVSEGEPLPGLARHLSKTAVSNIAQSIAVTRPLLRQMEELQGKMQGSPQALGALGALNRKTHGAGQILDSYLNTVFDADVKPGEWAADVLTGPDGSEVYAEQLQFMQRIARTLVDPSGPLANQEQGRAAQLLALSNEISDFLKNPTSPQQALYLFKKTKDTLREMDAVNRGLLNEPSYEEEMKKVRGETQGATPTQNTRALPTAEAVPADFLEIPPDQMDEQTYAKLTDEQRRAYRERWK